MHTKDQYIVHVYEKPVHTHVHAKDQYKFQKLFHFKKGYQKNSVSFFKKGVSEKTVFQNKKENTF